MLDTKLLAPVLFACSFFPQQPEPTVALIFGSEVEIMKLSEAKREHDLISKDEVLKRSKHSRYVALVLALGTVSEPQALPPNNTREFILNEVRRGVRRALQAENYYP